MPLAIVLSIASAATGAPTAPIVMALADQTYVDQGGQSTITRHDDYWAARDAKRPELLLTSRELVGKYTSMPDGSSGEEITVS